MSRISNVHARRILDSRGSPTIEVDVALEDQVLGRASVPSGASTGEREARELRDGDESRFLGKDVQDAIRNVQDIIGPELISMEVTDQAAIDRKMIELDGTENKSKLGANAIVGVSVAVARAAAADLGVPVYEYIGQLFGEDDPSVLPVPMFNVINGGVHADNNLELQEFMIVPLGAKDFSEAIAMGVEIFQSLKRILRKPEYKMRGVGDEGGFSPMLKRNEEAIELIIEAIEKARYRPGEDISIAIDSASSQFCKNGMYTVPSLEQKEMTSQSMVDWYSDMVEKYPIVSIEDGLAENDWDGWKLLTERLGKRIQLVGDDLFVTKAELLTEGIRSGVANAILIKVNQIGTLTETLEAIRVAKEAKYNTVISHRSGETEDTIICDIAVGCNAGQIKAGSLSRSERVAKYNQLLRIEEELGLKAIYKSCGTHGDD